MINKKTNEFIEKLVRMINESELPPVNVRMAVELVHAQLVEAEKKAIEEEEKQEVGSPVPGEVPAVREGEGHGTD